MNDGIGAREAFDRLAEVGHIGSDERIERLGGRSEVDASDVMTVLEQIRDDGASCFPVRAGDDDLHWSGRFLPVRVAGRGEEGGGHLPVTGIRWMRVALRANERQ